MQALVIAGENIAMRILNWRIDESLVTHRQTKISSALFSQIAEIIE